MKAYGVLSEAVATRRTVFATYQGSRRHLWPYGIDSPYEPELYVYVYEFPDERQKGSWHSLPVADLRRVMLTDEECEPPDFSARRGAIGADDVARYFD